MRMILSEKVLGMYLARKTMDKNASLQEDTTLPACVNRAKASVGFSEKCQGFGVGASAGTDGAI